MLHNFLNAEAGMHEGDELKCLLNEGSEYIFESCILYAPSHIISLVLQMDAHSDCKASLVAYLSHNGYLMRSKVCVQWECASAAIGQQCTDK